MQSLLTPTLADLRRRDLQRQACRRRRYAEVMSRARKRTTAATTAVVT
jgi:hypothetical protein